MARDRWSTNYGRGQFWSNQGEAHFFKVLKHQRKAWAGLWGPILAHSNCHLKSKTVIGASLLCSSGTLQRATIVGLCWYEPG
eukprot:168044-Rhodomonas_salina.1